MIKGEMARKIFIKCDCITRKEDKEVELNIFFALCNDNV